MSFNLADNIRTEMNEYIFPSILVNSRIMVVQCIWYFPNALMLWLCFILVINLYSNLYDMINMELFKYF